MNCQDVQKFIHAYLDGEFDEREWATLAAHLEQCSGCRRMAEFEERSARPLILICGMPKAKDPHTFLKPFRGLAQEVLAVPIEEAGYGRDPAELAAVARQEGIEAAHLASVEAAARFLSAREWPMPPRILITGSLHLAGEVLATNGTPPV